MESMSEKEWPRSPNQTSYPALACELGERTRFNNRVIGMECSASSSSGSSKRARAVNNGSQLVSCLVDGCIADLSKCRDYHRRHKVCEAHSKTPRVTIGGHEQRFCQQCSRFHSLLEFDEGKRSCRKRLDGHNRRRRKPQPESFPLNSGRFLSTQQGTRFMPFSASPQLYPTTSVGVSSCSGWESNTKPQSEPLHYSTQLSFSTDRKSTLHGSSSFPQTYGHGKQFPFLQCSGSSESTPAPNDFSALKIGGKLYSDGSSNRVINNNNTNSLGALSLLSSPMQQAHPHSSQPQYSSSLPRAQYDHAAPCMDGVPMGSEMYFEPNESSASASASHQTISFSWE